jgi:hypothetical protein
MLGAPVTFARWLASAEPGGHVVGRWAVGAACPSPESRYIRFLNGASKLSKASVHYLPDLSHRHRRERSRPDRLLHGLPGQGLACRALGVLGYTTTSYGPSALPEAVAYRRLRHSAGTFPPGRTDRRVPARGSLTRNLSEGHGAGARRFVLA